MATRSGGVSASIFIKQFAWELQAGATKRFRSLRSSSRWTRHFHGPTHLARIYRLNGDYAASVEERVISVELDGKLDQARMMRESFAKGGWDGFRRYVLQSDLNPLWAGVLDEDEKEKWIARLRTQADHGNFWLFLIKTDPGFDPLRSDPRFQELVKKFDPPK